MTDNSELAGLQALVADVGGGNVIDAELLEGCTVQAHELDEMDEDQAARVAAHCFSVLFDHKVERLEGTAADAAIGVWSGKVGNVRFGFGNNSSAGSASAASPAPSICTSQRWCRQWNR